MKKWVLRIILVVIAVVLLVGTLSACGDEWAGFVEVENVQEFVSALNDPGVDKIKVKSGVYGDKTNFENEYTRIVGFYTPIKSWSKERKAEFKLREWEHV